MPVIHHTHTPYQSYSGIECHRCWGCECHSPSILAEPCTFTVEIETYPADVIESVERQSALYGAQVRFLEVSGFIKNGIKVRRAWDEFKTQLQGTALLEYARMAYFNAYEK